MRHLPGFLKIVDDAKTRIKEVHVHKVKAWVDDQPVAGQEGLCFSQIPDGGCRPAARIIKEIGSFLRSFVEPQKKD